jgi:hypothetical protein
MREFVQDRPASKIPKISCDATFLNMPMASVARGDKGLQMWQRLTPN